MEDVVMDAVFTLAVRMDNEAFKRDKGLPSELGRILHHLADRLVLMNPADRDSRPIYDIDGKRCGEWSISPLLY
jgi:hypothetical protein